MSGPLLDATDFRTDGEEAEGAELMSRPATVPPCARRRWYQSPGLYLAWKEE